MTTDQKIKSNETMAVEGNNKGRSYYRCDEEEHQDNSKLQEKAGKVQTKANTANTSGPFLYDDVGVA